MTGREKDREAENELFRILAGLEKPEDMRRFLTDLCTRQEISDMAERWQIAKLLDQEDMSYREISAATGASTTTIGRVARFLQQEDFGGYRLVLDRLSK